MIDILPPPESLDDDAKLQKFKEDLTRDFDVGESQRWAANEDMRFINVPGGMWEDFHEDVFDDNRVKMEFDITSNHVQRYLGEWDNNRAAVEFKPDDGATTDDDAELLNGIYRSDFNNFSGALATDTAVQEAVTCGYGAMKLVTKFEDDEDAENDNQRAAWKSIYSAYNTTVWDESSKDIDKRDANHCTELVPFTKETFKRKYPDNSPISVFDPNRLSSLNNDTDRADFIYIGVRYEVVRKKEPVFVYNNLETATVEVYSKEDHEKVEDELRADETRQFVRERKVTRQSVEKTVFSGDTILVPTRRIVGKWIPIIPFFGVRAYVDGVETYRGLVRKQKDAQRLFNIQTSQVAENSGSAGQEVPIFDRSQVEAEDVKEAWADKNNKPYLPIDALRDEDGNIVTTGPVAYSKPQQLDPSTAALLDIVPNFIRETTGGAPQDTLDTDASGKAIRALIKRENLNTAIINRNIANAVEWSGVVYQAMAAEIYTTQRIIRTIGLDGAETSTQLSETIFDEESGRFIETNTLSGKKFRASSDVGPQYETLAEETVEVAKNLIELMQGVPGGEQFIAPLVSIVIENMPGSGFREIKDLNRRNQVMQGIKEPETEEEKQLVAQIQEQQNQPDPQEQFLEAAAVKEEAEARNLEAASVKNLADAELKGAQTIETLVGVELDQAKISLEVEKQADQRQNDILDRLENFPVG